MNNANKNNIFAATAHPPTEELVKYVNKQLEADATRSVENHIADCEPCSDAVDGLLLSKQNIADIDKNLEQRIQAQLINTKKVIPLYKRWYMATAAMLALVFVSGYLILNYVGKNNSVADVITTEKAVEETATTPANETAVEQTETVEDKKAIANKAVTIETLKDDVPADMPVPESSKEKALANVNTDEKFKQPTIEKREDLASGKQSEQTVAADESRDDSQDQPAVAEKTAAYTQTKDVQATTEMDDEKVPAQNAKNVEELSKKSNKPAAATTSGGAATTLDNVVVLETKAKRKKVRLESNDATFDYSAFEQARTLYNNKEYAKALPMFEALMVHNTDNKFSFYYAGMCAYYQNNHKLADTYLSQSSGDKRFEMYELSMWYQALSLIQLNKPAEAKNLLVKVVNLKQSKKDEAANLLKELK
ncbi:MAG: hypothetical protein IPP29_09200 [Bacteroidetes bacterium]|nr:hypothetical protein [Bacteroidota bacterium]